LREVLHWFSPSNTC